MRRLLFDLAALIACQLFDVYERARDIYVVRLRGRHRRIVRQTEAARPDAPMRRVAIVAIYPSKLTWCFLFNALAALRANAFHVIVVSNRTLDDADRQAIVTRADRLIERLPVGRDFGAYQTGLRALGLGGAGIPEGTELLLLMNDSMFYRRDSAALFREIVALPGDWLSMFENYEYSYHAQSFFMAFRPRLFRSAIFQRYWQRYVPYSSRHYTINAGEVGFSNAMRRAGFQVTAYFNSTRLTDVLFDRLTQSGSLAVALDLLPASSEIGTGDASLTDRRAGTPALEPDGKLGTLRQQVVAATLIENRALALSAWMRVLWRIVQAAEISNPTHFTGLLLNKLDLAPLKRDVCYRGTFAIAHIVRAVADFDPAQRTALEADLRGKGLPASITGLRKLLFHRGRI